jgi:hypothetical protein
LSDIEIADMYIIEPYPTTKATNGKHQQKVKIILFARIPSFVEA